MQQHIAQRMQGITAFYVMDLLKRAKQLEQQGQDIIHMEIGEPDFPTPPTIVTAATDFLKTGQVKYTSAAGLPALRQAIADYYLENYAVSVSSQRIFITPGASGAFLLAFGISLNPGESIMMADPCYPCNANFVKFFQAYTQYVSVYADTQYQLNAQLIDQHWQSNTKGVIIASPANPTGTLISDTDLQAAIAYTEGRGGCFYADEIYHGLVYDTLCNTALKYSDNVFVINSFSKFFGMTGWRLGWLVVPEAFVDVAEKLAQNIFIAASTPAQYAALAAFDAETKLELLRRREELKLRRDFLYENLLKLGFKIDCKPQGAFYIYADCRKFTNDSFQFAENLLENAGVAVTPGKDFGYNQPESYIRFAYTASVARMTEALTRITRFL